MELDVKLLRKILEAYENLPYGGSDDPIKIDGYSDDQINAHQELLMDANYIKATKNAWISGGIEITSENITLEGHEFLNKLRNDTIWKKILAAFESLSPLALKAGLD